MPRTTPHLFSLFGCPSGRLAPSTPSERSRTCALRLSLVGAQHPPQAGAPCPQNPRFVAPASCRLPVLPGCPTGRFRTWALRSTLRLRPVDLEGAPSSFSEGGLFRSNATLPPLLGLACVRTAAPSARPLRFLFHGSQVTNHESRPANHESGPTNHNSLPTTEARQ